jgi:hypothetical protein
MLRQLCRHGCAPSQSIGQTDFRHARYCTDRGSFEDRPQGQSKARNLHTHRADGADVVGKVMCMMAVASQKLRVVAEYPCCQGTRGRACRFQIRGFSHAFSGTTSCLDFELLFISTAYELMSLH